MSEPVSQYRTVLVPVDGSDENREAIDHAIAVANAFDASLHALSVVEGAGATQQDMLRTNVEAGSEDAVDLVEEKASRAGLDVTTAVRTGVPYEEIVEYVRESDVDMVVMGTHGRTGLKHTLIGSVAERVVRHSPVPVTTVRPAE